jgi:GTP-binding protein
MPTFRGTTFLRGATGVVHFPAADRPEVAFAGPSNVGKSSLLNALTGNKKLALVSRTPGRTREVNFFSVGEDCRLVDLPGFGYAMGSKQSRALLEVAATTYIEKRECIAAVVCLFDCRRMPGEREIELIGWLTSLGRPIVPVATKIDKLSRTERGAVLAKIAGALGLPVKALIATSSDSGEGLKELNAVLWQKVEQLRPTLK